MIKINLLKPKWQGILFYLGRGSKTLPCNLKFVYDGKVMELKGNRFKPATIKLKGLVGPKLSDDPIENKFMNDMVNGR